MRGQQAHKQMLHSSDIRETKSEATVRYTSHYENGKCSEAAKAGTEMLEPSRVALGGGAVRGHNMCSHCGNQFGGFLRVKHDITTWQFHP